MIAFAYEPLATGTEMSDHRHALEERGKALTDEALEQVAGSGIQTTTAVVDARPAEGLLALADEHHRSPVPVLVVLVPDA